MKRFWLVCILAVSLVAPDVARADSISLIKTDVDLSKTGTAAFQETIDYVFTSQRHGIFRDIPFSTQLSAGQYLNYNFQINSIQRNGQVEPASESTNGAYRRLKIGDPNTTITGNQRYVIQYTLSPFVRKDPAGDYITVNMFGDRWEVAAQNVAGRLVLPEETTITSYECFTGRQGEKKRDCTVEKTGNSSLLVTSTTPLQPGNGMTLDVVVPAGSFTEGAYIVPASKSTAGSTSSGEETPTSRLILNWVFFLIFFGGGLWTVFRGLTGKIRRRRAQKQQTIVAQYDPPDNLYPAEIGLVTDEVSDTRDVTATLIDLARRGFLTITYSEEQRTFGKKQRYLLTRVQSSAPIEPFEQTLLNGFFLSGNSVYVDEIKPASVLSAVSSFKVQVKDRLVAKGWYLTTQNNFSDENLTPAGYQEWAKVEGLKLYLNVAEKDRMEFAEAPAKTPERFTKLLPYAIALGVEKEWAKQFEGIDVSSATNGWYSGGDMANAYLMSTVLASSFASSISTSVAPPTGSSGFGGGFSGGGGGGGGGGSW